MKIAKNSAIEKLANLAEDWDIDTLIQYAIDGSRDFYESLDNETLLEEYNTHIADDDEDDEKFATGVA